MSLRRMIKAHGLGNFAQMGFAVATSPAIATAPRPSREAERVQKLEALGIKGQNLSHMFEVYNETARMITGAGVSLINLLDEKCAYTVSAAGVGYDPSIAGPAGLTFCQYTLMSPEPFIIYDTEQDERFSGTALTKPPINARFYAGFPLATSEGFVIGTFCIVHDTPMELNDTQMETMRKLAHAVTAQMLLSSESTAFTASRMGEIMGKLLSIVPEATISEIQAFLDFIARGSTSDAGEKMLKEEGIIETVNGNLVLTDAGRSLKQDLNLAPETFRSQALKGDGAQANLDDLLERLG